MDDARPTRSSRISLGILAHDEAPRIAATLASLVEQTLVRGGSVPSRTLEIVCIANGCSDDTARVTRSFFENWSARRPDAKGVVWRVVEVAQPGKSNAWNLFVHSLSDRAADILFLMDADIHFLEEDVLERMIQSLEEHPSACVAVDVPTKHIALKARKTILDRLSLGVSATDGRGHALICGQLYCGWASALQEVTMPVGLSVEDGFLRAMIVTRRFTAPEEFDRVVLADGAHHVFTAYTRVFDVYRHEKRLMVGIVLNSFLFDDLWRNSKPELDAGVLIRERNDRDPRWLEELLRSALARRGPWVIPSQMLTRRFVRLRGLDLRRKLLRLPSAVAGFALDIIVAVAANQTLRTGTAIGIW